MNMAWKCNSCGTEIDISEGATINFCPGCGSKIKMEQEAAPEQTVATNNNCPVCCTTIEQGDDVVVCPDCSMQYHKDCWNDNNGCATYGCKSAGCLNPPPMTVDVSMDTPHINPQGGSSIRCPHCNTSLEQGSPFCWSCGKEVNATVVDTNAPLAGPWERWAARLIDFTWESFIIGIFIGLVWDMTTVPDAVAGIIFAPFAFLLDSAIYAIFGNTLGKWLFGIKHIENSGISLTAGRYFSRNLSVYWGGYGLAVPIATLCTFIHQYNRVSKEQPASYDEKLGMKCISHNANGFKRFLGILLFIATLIILAALRAATK